MHRSDVIAAAIDDVNGLFVVELGLWDGRTAQRVMTLCPNIKRYIGVDHFQHGPNDDVTGWDQSQHDAHKRTVLAMVEQWPSFELIVGDTAATAATMPNGVIDVVFIDADHSYQGVTRDLAAWAPKLAPGGVMMGHDIDWETVERAVSDFYPGQSISRLGDNVWRA